MKKITTIICIAAALFLTSCADRAAISIEQDVSGIPMETEAPPESSSAEESAEPETAVPETVPPTEETTAETEWKREMIFSPMISYNLT